MSNNLVDNVLQDMQMNNSPGDMAYQPNMTAMAGPVQPQGNVNMGNLQYAPPDYQVAPGGEAMYPQRQPVAGMMPPQMQEDDMDVPDMGDYGMEESGASGMMSGLTGMFGGMTDAFLVIVLAVIFTLPQVNQMVRGTLSQFVQNPLYLNILQAVILGLVFYVVKMFL